MARIGVTKEDVFAACNALLKEGVNLTVANVREELGTGSYTTLLPLIDAFKAVRKEAALKTQEEAESSYALPKDLTEQGTKVIEDLWSQAMNQAHRKIEEITTSFRKELAAMKTELALKLEELSQALSDITRLEKENELILSENEKKAHELQQKEGEIKLLKAQLKEKDLELKTYLERAVVAENKLENFKNEKKQ